MGRGRDFRGGGKSRRPYEEDAAAPAATGDRPQSRQPARNPLPAEGTAVDAIVKWFNPDKGFGFAEIADGSGDAFLHVKVVQALGLETLPPGAKLSVLVGQGQKGRQITRWWQGAPYARILKSWTAGHPQSWTAGQRGSASVTVLAPW